MDKKAMDSFIQKICFLENGDAISETVDDYKIIVIKEEYSKYHLTIWFAHNSKPLHNEYYKTPLNLEAALKKLHYIYY